MSSEDSRADIAVERASRYRALQRFAFLVADTDRDGRRSPFLSRGLGFIACPNEDVRRFKFFTVQAPPDQAHLWIKPLLILEAFRILPSARQEIAYRQALRCLRLLLSRAPAQKRQSTDPKRHFRSADRSLPRAAQPVPAQDPACLWQLSPCFRRLAQLDATAEWWPSGRRHTPAKGADGKPSRGFESLPLRHHISHCF